MKISGLVARRTGRRMTPIDRLSDQALRDVGLARTERFGPWQRAFWDYPHFR